MKKLLLFVFAVLSFCVVNAQFFNAGPLLGIGFGGINGKGLTVKSGINPEIGYVIKYNFTEKTSVRTFITMEFHNFKLQDGKEVADVYATPLAVTNAPVYEVKAKTFTQHVDFTYIVKENTFDISGGAFWALKFTKPFIDESLPRVFYNSTDAEILALPNQTGVFQSNEGDQVEQYASDQIQHSIRGINYGVYLAATAGTEHFKVMLRYDLFLKNYYSAYSTTNKIKENYLRLGLIYFMN